MTRLSLPAALLAALLPAAAGALSSLEEPPGLADLPEAAPASMETPSPSGPTPTVADLADEKVSAAAEAEDDPKIKKEVEAESRELQDLRKAEEQVGVGAVTAPAVTPPAPAATPGEERIPGLPEIDHGLAKLQGEFDIPIDVNEAVVEFVRFFQNPIIRPHFVKWLSRYYRYEARYRAILKEHGLPEDTIFLSMIESGFANLAYSRARASGPWQFIAPTGRMFGLQQDFWVDERRDPEKAAHAAARYLAELRQQTGDWRLAWAGYNAGAGTVLRGLARGAKDFWDMTKGRVLRRETKGYVPKLMAAAILTKHREAFGFGDDEVEKLPWVDFDEVEVKGSALIPVIARAAGVDEAAIMELNPELRRAVTPPRPYKLKLPRGSGETFAQCWPALEQKARATFAGHEVRRGDTLGAIAAKFGVPVEGIMQLNGLTSARRLRIGQELLIPIPRAGARPAPEVAEPAKATPAKATTPVAVPAPGSAAAPAAPTASARLAGTPIMEPAGYRPPPTPINGPRHVVQDGDTLWSISQRLGIDLDSLCRWNGIRNPRRYTLRIGTELLVKPMGG